jgi:hypothetical protein
MVVDHRREIQVHNLQVLLLALMLVHSSCEAVGSRPYQRSAQSEVELKL